MFLLAVAAFFVRQGLGVASLKIWQKSFLKSFFFLSANVSFGGCRWLRAAGVGGRYAQNPSKIFFKIFLFSAGFFLWLPLLRAAGVGGSLRSKSVKNLF